MEIIWSTKITQEVFDFVKAEEKRRAIDLMYSSVDLIFSTHIYVLAKFKTKLSSEQIQSILNAKTLKEIES